MNEKEDKNKHVNTNNNFKNEKITEKVIEDNNYFYICITKNLSMTSQNEVIITSRKKEDKSKDLIKAAREIMEKL